MQDSFDIALRSRWFPVARAEELVPRHVMQAQLLDQEIGLWRDDQGQVNAWENRCPHRGVRFSIGLNTGTELRCQYHGWHYASGSGQCIFIPAHPDQKPSNVIRATLYDCVEKYGLLWVRFNISTVTGEIPDLGVSGGLALRSLFIDAPPSRVKAYLAQSGATGDDPFICMSDALVFLLQPVSANQTVLHAILKSAETATQRLETLILYNRRLKQLRTAMELQAA